MASTAAGFVVLLLLGTVLQIVLSTPVVARSDNDLLSSPQPVSDDRLSLQPGVTANIGNSTYRLEAGDDGDIFVVQEETGRKESVRDFCLTREDGDDCSIVDELAFFLLELKGTFQGLANGALGIFLISTGLVAPQQIY